MRSAWRPFTLFTPSAVAAVAPCVLAANLWVLCRSPVREVNIVGERLLKPDSSPPAWNARRTTVGAVVLCVCGVLLGREGESGIAAGGTASLPGGGGITAGAGGIAA